LIPDDLDSWIFGDAGNWSAELAELVETVRPEFERWFVEGGEAGMDKLRAAASFTVSNPEIQTQLDAYTFKFATQVGGTFAQDLRDTLKEGLDSGESAAQLRKRVIAAGHGTISDYKAAMIARRESVNALNMGAHEAYRQQGVPATVWRAGPSACEFCIALDGKVISIDSTYANVGDTVNVDVDGKQRAFTVGYENVSHPPLHPFCRCSTDAVELEDLEDARAAAPADPVTPGGVTPAPKPEPKPEAVESVAQGYRAARHTSLDAFDLDAIERIERHTDEDMWLRAIYSQQGFDDLPRLVSQSEMDKLDTAGARILYRGIQDRTFCEQLQTGEHYAGAGMYGNGTYTAYGPDGLDIASLYKGWSGKGGILRMTLAPEARVITESQLSELFYAAQQASASGLSMVARDQGRFAAMLGYDAIDVESRQFMVVLNRTALIIQDAIL